MNAEILIKKVFLLFIFHAPELVTDKNWWRLKTLADIHVAQFFIPKMEENKNNFITDSEYRKYLAGTHAIGQAVAKALVVAQEKRFFHWFLEFPEVFEHGGFDNIEDAAIYYYEKQIECARLFEIKFYCQPEYDEETNIIKEVKSQTIKEIKIPKVSIEKE